jgi:hypothetical protein
MLSRQFPRSPRVLSLALTLLTLAACSGAPSTNAADVSAAQAPAVAALAQQQRALPPVVFPETAVAADDATWVEVTSVTGEGNLRTDPFELSGAPVRIRSTLDGSIALLALFVVPAGTEQPSGFPDLISTRIGEPDEIVLSKPAGSYQLEIQSFVGSWSIVVEQAES